MDDTLLACILDEDDPVSYDEAMSSENKAKWTEAVESAIKALEENDTWIVEKNPNNAEVIDSKWVFKGKKDEAGNISKFKARLVARGFKHSEAANVLTALEVSEANYDKAWDLLCERYENKRVIIQTHLNSISDIQNIQKESHILLRSIIDTVNQHLRSLESLGLPVDKWDTIIIHLLGVPQRIKEVRKLNACNNCLRKGHSARDCKNQHSCKKCSLRHNTLLHLEKEKSSTEHNLAPSQNNETSNLQSVSNISQSTLTACSAEYTHSDSYVMLPTAIVLIFDKYGNSHECRAILDNCSQSNFITEKLFKILQLPTSNVTHSVEGFGSNITSVLHKTWATLKSKTNSYILKDVPFLISNKITKDLPAISVNLDNLKIPPNVVLADERFNETGPIDLLIGASIFWDLISIGRINLPGHHAILQKTKLGWIFSGPLPISHEINSESICNVTLQNNNIHDLLERFWKIEEQPAKIQYSPEEAEGEKHFVDTTTRDETGRFVVSLPTKENINQLGESFDLALKRFYAVERKLLKNPQFKEQYVSFMNEYEKLGHMTKINTSNDSTQDTIFYLPHHGVMKMSSATTKLRVVFDGSAKTSSGISLNDVLMVGPTIQDDLFTIVIRFRSYKYVVTADIEKMYRMVKIRSDQRDLQRILWRSDPSQSLNHFQLNTVTYGTASASFLAIRALLQVAKENESKFPKASEVIKSSFYVDDLLTGFNCIEDGKQVLSELVHILSSAGFNLRKFVSNNSEILEHITQAFL
ncbi:uncharacterized protein LOC123684598 [Harmonia axyridis]|uniref:uncharacterized protein LOC123684598 n=1 Tax=Harmonia axyridis TaxID=115357 RepID=UPI001E2759C6|nr:uncharacterized protein LOC123684598 [Harmonia axyridis]